MFRRSLTCLALLGAFAFTAIQAQDPAKPSPAAPRDTKADNTKLDPTVDQTMVASKYRQLEEALLRIAQKMDKGSPEARKKSVIIFKALKQAKDQNIAVNLGDLAEDLKKPGLADLKKAIDKGKVAETELRALLVILLAEDDGKGKIEELKALIKALEEAIKSQKQALAQNASPSVEKDTANKSQENATKKTDKILKDIKDRDKKPADAKGEGKGEPKPGEAKPGEGKPGEGKPGEGKPGEGKPGEGKPGEGKPKEGKPGEGKPGEGKPGEGKPGEGKPGEGGGESKPGQPQEGDSTPGREKIQDANDYQKKAEDKIKKDKRADAGDDQVQAINNLEQAKKTLEEILRQLREEEIERILADLERRCVKMLQMQEIVYENTKKIDNKIQESSDKKASREEEVFSRTQSQREDDIVKEADLALRLIEEEGTAVAFAEVFRQVRSDMVHVSTRLAKVDVGRETQMIEEDIIQTLKEMIEALKKAQQESRDRKNSGPSGPPPPQNLIDLLAELRMIKMMQLRVNRRTGEWAKRYQGEQALDKDIVKELKDLAQRQFQIHGITENIAKGRNR